MSLTTAIRLLLTRRPRRALVVGEGGYPTIIALEVRHG